MVSWLWSREALLLRTTLFLPFALFWGIAFAHHVQLLILAHLTKSPFPAAWKHPLLILSALAAADARVGLVQTSDERVKQTVLVCLGLGVVVYAHPSPAEVARAQGKADAPISDDDVPRTEKVDATGVKKPTEAGLLKREKK